MPVAKKRLLALLAIAAAVAAIAWLPNPLPSNVAPRGDAVVAKRGAEPASGERFATLAPRETMAKAETTLFSPQSWATVPQAPGAAAQAPARPVQPPMPYRVAGRVFQDNAMQIILARGDAILAVREGDTLEGDYRVETIAADRVTLLYTPLGVREDLPVISQLAIDEPPGQPSATPSAAAAPPAPQLVTTQAKPAELRWVGPMRVRAGSAFNVALKLTSADAVRAAPLQLEFDAATLRPVAVRAGEFFAGGMFSYRVNPAGSIFIGASGKGAVPSDAEFVIVSFETLRDSGSAELKVSSLNLQDPGGRAIAFQPPGAYRALIVQ
jgi:hypothetical protein